MGYVSEKNCKINNNVIVFAFKHDLIKKDYVFQNLTFNKCSVIIFFMRKNEVEDYCMNHIETVIDLTIDSGKITPKNLIHLNDFYSIKNTIDSLVPNNESISNNGNELTGYYKSIFVEGARGTGKTTFLKTVYQYYKEETDVAVLDFFDPTLIENKASIFLTVIALIKKLVFEKLDSCPYKKTDACDRKKWETCMEKLSEGLPVVDEFSGKVSVPNYWDDDFMIMEKGLNSVSSAFDLRKNFKKLVEVSLELLGKKAFLLIIDDADTDCTKTFPLLETLRKYLCIEGFITVVSGNYDLFSLTLKTQYYSRFQSTKNYDAIIENQVNELVEQYFRKVFPIENRIMLQRLKMLLGKYILAPSDPKIQKFSVKYYVSQSDVDTYPLNEYLRLGFYYLGIRNPYQLSVYTDYILNLPLRTLINILRFLREFVSNGEKIYIKDETLITQIFIEELKTHNVDISLVRGFPHSVSGVILKFLLENNELYDYYQLQPISNDVSKNGAIFSLSILLSLYIQKYPELLFSYMIKIGFLRNISVLFTQKSKKDTVKYYYSFESLISHGALFYDTDLKPSMGNMIAYLRSMAKSKYIETFPGVIDVSKIKIAKLLKDKSSIKSYIALFPYTCSYYSEKNKVHEYSIYTLIATVFDILREFSTGVQVPIFIKKKAQPRDYMMTFEKMPEAVKVEKDDKLDEDLDSDLNSSFYSNDFYNELSNWTEYIKRIRAFISIHVLAKACTRMFYSLSHTKIRSNSSPEDIMQNWIIMFFNSVLIEELLENNSWNQGREVTVLTDNSVNAFKQNIETCIKEQICENLTLTKVIISCPLFLEFIDWKNYGIIVKFLEELAAKDHRYLTGKFQTEKYKDNTYCYMKNLLKTRANNTNSSEDK